MTRTIRDDFLDFYHKEIIKARNMGMQLAKTEIDENTGEPTLKASDKFLNIMQTYFTDLASGKRAKPRNIGVERLDAETPELEDMVRDSRRSR